MSAHNKNSTESPAHLFNSLVQQPHSRRIFRRCHLQQHFASGLCGRISHVKHGYGLKKGENFVQWSQLNAVATPNVSQLRRWENTSRLTLKW